LVATGVVPLATGGDGGGSIRIPAAFSGIYGLKPSYGLVPNQPGAVGTLGVYGGLSRDVSDTALLLSVLGQPDPRDSFAVPYQSMDYFASLDQGVSGLRIAWSPNLGFPIVDHAVADGITTAVEALRAAGAEVSTVALDLSDARDALDVIWRAAFSGMVRDMDGVQLASLDPGLLHLALSSAKLTASALQKAQDAMRALSQRMQLFHQDYDLLLAPTLPITAFEAGLDTPDPSRFPCWYDWTPFTWPFNLTRQPAASVPCGFVAGLPIGLQIIGPMFSEALILRASRCVEQACGSDRRPPGT
jgi:aspartyl-tRNA(Asn)/glutamyl-tRNA(Gln) amidotransferase subunit A